jgi:hypothetical protein
MLANLRLGNGGTLDPVTFRLVRPGGGYAVGLADGEQLMTVHALRQRTLREYVRRYPGPGAYLGVWIDRDEVCLNWSVIISEWAAAMALAVEQGQRAMYEFATDTVVPVSGTSSPPSLGDRLGAVARSMPVGAVKNAVWGVHTATGKSIRAKESTGSRLTAGFSDRE